MEFEGRVMKLLPVRSGQKSDGSEWRSQEFVFEYFENPDNWWSEKVVLSLMNERIDEYQLKEGDEVRVNFGHSVREYQGRYYNEMRLRKLTKKEHPSSDEDAQKKEEPAAVAQGKTTQRPPHQQGAVEEKKDDLPF